MGEPDLEYEAMVSDMAEWAHWSESIYGKEETPLVQHYVYYRSWPYSKLKSEWENFFGRDFSKWVDVKRVM